MAQQQQDVLIRQFGIIFGPLASAAKIVIPTMTTGLTNLQVLKAMECAVFYIYCLHPDFLKTFVSQSSNLRGLEYDEGITGVCRFIVPAEAMTGPPASFTRAHGSIILWAMMLAGFDARNLTSLHIVQLKEAMERSNILLPLSLFWPFLKLLSEQSIDDLAIYDDPIKLDRRLERSMMQLGYGFAIRKGGVSGLLSATQRRIVRGDIDRIILEFLQHHAKQTTFILSPSLRSLIPNDKKRGIFEELDSQVPGSVQSVSDDIQIKGLEQLDIYVQDKLRIFNLLLENEA